VRVLRYIANTALRSGLSKLDGANSDAMNVMLRHTSRFARLIGLPLPDFMNATLLRDIVANLAHAIVNTDYGQPLRLQHPLIVTVAASDYCPFACINCYSNSGHSRDRDATAASDIFERLAESKTPFVMITGGEPLAAPGICDSLECLLSAQKVVHVFTNASTAKYLSIGERYPATLRFVFPVWGTRQRHNERRGERSFERLEENLQTLSAHNLPANLLLVIADNDLAVFESVAELCEKYQISTVRITRKVLAGRHDRSQVDFSPEFRIELKRRIRCLQGLVPGGIITDIPEFRRTRGYRSMLQKLLGIPSYGSCAAGNWMMHVDTNGMAYPCFTFEGSDTFTARPELSLEQQWLRMKELRGALGETDVCVGEAHAGA
jgi:MoaA/NifB/PqqE/SkfB family radical SAM enzyme